MSDDDKPKKDTRVWAYGPNGEAEIFDSPKEVPKSWAGSPAEFEQSDDDDDVDASNKELREFIEAETGKTPAKNTSRSALVAKYKELVGE